MSLPCWTCVYPCSTTDVYPCSTTDVYPCSTTAVYPCSTTDVYPCSTTFTSAVPLKLIATAKQTGQSLARILFIHGRRSNTHTNICSAMCQCHNAGLAVRCKCHINGSSFVLATQLLMLAGRVQIGIMVITVQGNSQSEVTLCCCDLHLFCLPLKV